MSASWTIQQLGREVEACLAGDEEPANGQVRAVPDERTIRYYTTLGLLDRPTLRGRTALYGRRHLAQLVAIKRLQAEGRALAEIQRVLPTLDDAALAKLSGVGLGASRRRAGRRDFWRGAGTVVAAAPPDAREPDGETTTDAPSDERTPSLASLLELTLAPGVRLTLHAARPASDADAAALLVAAAPLLAELERRHLVAPPSSLTSHARPEPDPEDCP